MKKQIKHSHPYYEECGQWAQFNNFSSKKSLRQSFSDRREWAIIRGAELIFIYQTIGFSTARETAKRTQMQPFYTVRAIRRENIISQVFQNSYGILLNTYNKYLIN